MAEGTGRAQPFNCPYCGEEELRPGDEERQYVCLACNRKFELKFLGIAK